MDLLDVFRIFRRWLWLIGLVLVVAGGAAWLALRSAEPIYEARVKLQLSIPQREDVAIYDQYRSSSARDDLVVARNNLVQLAQSDQVRSRTQRRLGLTDQDAGYELKVDIEREADYVYLVVGSRSAGLAADIANAHVAEAIAYYGELRVLPTHAEKELFAAQLAAAEQEFGAAENSFAQFQAQQGIDSLDQELSTQRRLLEQLQQRRDALLIEQAGEAALPIAGIEELIAERRAELERLAELAPWYELLVENERLARESYASALSEYAGVGPEAASEAAERLLATAGGAGIGAAAAPPGGLPQRLAAAEAGLRAAGDALSRFRLQNDVVFLDGELAAGQRQLDELRLERDSRLMGETTLTAGMLAEVDRLIAQRQRELDRLSALESGYQVLAQNAEQARSTYQYILSKYTEADLRAATVQAANFIQVVEEARAPSEPASSWKTLLALAVVGSLGLAIVLAFLFDYIFPRRAPAPAAGGSGQAVPIARG